MTDSSTLPHSFSWSFSTLGCPSFTLDEVISLARQHSISQFEIRALNDRLDIPKYLLETYGSIQNIRKTLDEASIRIAALDSSAKLIDCPQAARDELLDFAQMAHELNIPYIRVFDGGSFEPTLSEKDRKASLDFLAWWDEIRRNQKWNTNIVIETHDALCSSQSCLDLDAAYDGQIRLLWDSHHTWRKGGEHPAHSWLKLKHLVQHIHFKDSIDLPSARHPFTYVHLGDGEFPLGQFFQQLSLDKYTGPMSLEWELKWHPYLDSLDAALSRLQSYRPEHTSTSI